MIKKIAYLSVLTSLIGASVISIDIGAFQLSIYRLIVILLTYLIGLKLLLKNEKYVRFEAKKGSYPIQFMIIWLLYSLISICWVKDYAGWVKANYFLGIGVLCILIYRRTFNTTKEIFKALQIISVMAVFHNLIGWYEIITGRYLFLTNSQIYYSQNKLPVSMFGNTNDFATFMLISLWILIVCMINSKSKIIKLVYICVVISSISLLIMTASRANILGFILSLLVFLYLYMKNKRGYKIIIGILFIIFLVILLIPGFLNYFIEMIYINLNSSFSDNNGSDFIRENLIKNGLKFIVTTLGFGTGAGNIEYWMSNYGEYFTYGVTNIHNWWMEILTGYGIIIFFLYIVFYIKLMKGLYNIFKHNQNKMELTISLGFLCSMSGFIFGSISSSSNISREWLWVFWAIVVSFQGSISIENTNANPENETVYCERNGS